MLCSIQYVIFIFSYITQYCYYMIHSVKSKPIYIYIYIYMYIYSYLYLYLLFYLYIIIGTDACICVCMKLHNIT